MRTPTLAQRRILESMARGARLHTMAGLDVYAFIGDKTMRHVLLSTVRVLRAAGWVEPIREDWRGSAYRISRRGRRALLTPGRGRI